MKETGLVILGLVFVFFIVIRLNPPRPDTPQVAKQWEQVQEPRRDQPVYAASNGLKAEVIPDMFSHVNAGFYTIDCDYWVFQSGCQHFGTDIVGNGEGTIVYAPFSGTVVGCTDNGEGGPYIGIWLEYDDEKGARHLINHFRAVDDCASGSPVVAGQSIGTMRGDANHVHMQVTYQGQLVDFEEYWENY